jgi:peptidoglycan hydrolase CwlO-like protein
MTTGNRVADGLDQHLYDESQWEIIHEKIEARQYAINQIERKKDDLQERWDDLECKSQQLQEEIDELEAEI